MTMRSPVVAMLWENWRLTRTETVWHLALGIVAASAVLVVFAAVAPNETAKDFGAVIALVLIMMFHSVGWFSINKLNFERPGFPFYLLYTRPVRTAVAVGIAMAYWAVVSAALYLVSALLLRIASGYAFPLFAGAAWITAVNLTSAAVNWSIRNPAVRTLGHLAVGVAWAGLAMQLLTVEEIPGPDLAPPDLWPTLFDFPLTYYALTSAIGLASFALTVAAVARQRRGDGRAAMPWTPGTGFPDGLVSLFQFPCPTSSATRAQVWFELRSRGLPLLTIGLALAIVNPLLFAISGPIDALLSGGYYARPAAMLFAMLSVLGVLNLAANAFGIRWRPARLYASGFETAQPYGTARLAGLKVLVRSVCVLAVLVAVGVSVWASMSLIAVGDGYEPLRSWHRAIESAVGAMTGSQQIALAVVACIGVAVMVASHASFAALAARYPRRLDVWIAGWLVLLHGLVLVVLVLNGYRGVGSKPLWEFLLSALVWVTRWIDAPATVLATVYVSWMVFAERLLTPRAAFGAVLVSAALGAAWVTVLQAAGAQLAGRPAMDAVWMLSPALLPLMASVLVPWSFSRIRHT
jgi:hypothetical protein